jgi:hypothetical protein
MKRAAMWRAVAAEHLVKAQATSDVHEAALHTGIASDLHAKALAEEIGGAQPIASARLDFRKLRATLRLVVSRS